MSKYTITTESYQTEFKTDAITADALDLFNDDAYIYILNADGQQIFAGEVKDAPAAIATLADGMRVSLVNGTYYTTRIGAQSFVAGEPTQFEQDYMDIATASLGNRFNQ